MAKFPIDDLGHPGDSKSGLLGAGGHAWRGRMASAGAFLLEVAGMGMVGLLCGLGVGARDASRKVALLPPPPVPAPPGPGFAPRGGRELEAAGIWFGNLVVNGIIGLAFGLAIGVALATFLLALRASRARRLAGQ